MRDPVRDRVVPPVPRRRPGAHRFLRADPGVRARSRPILGRASFGTGRNRRCGVRGLRDLRTARETAVLDQAQWAVATLQRPPPRSTHNVPGTAGRRRRNTAVGIEVAALNAMRSVLLLACLGIAATSLMAGAGDVDRIQGVVTELHPQGFVLATEGRTVVVDMSALGGITMALAKGQAIVAIGTLEPEGKTL